MMNELTVTDVGTGTRVGRIWLADEDTIRTEPDGLVALVTDATARFPHASAPELINALDGYSNGYVKVGAAT